MKVLTEPGKGLRFDIYERIHVAEDDIGISELHEVELIPHIQVIAQDDQAILRGNLLLTGQYIGEDESDKRLLEHLIPVEISLPMNRITRIEDILVEIENFDVELLSTRNLNVTGVLSLHGIELSELTASPSYASVQEESQPESVVYESHAGVSLNNPWMAEEEVTFTHEATIRSVPPDIAETHFFPEAPQIQQPFQVAQVSPIEQPQTPPSEKAYISQFFQSSFGRQEQPQIQEPPMFAQQQPPEVQMHAHASSQEQSQLQDQPQTSEQEHHQQSHSALLQQTDAPDMRSTPSETPPQDDIIEHSIAHDEVQELDDARDALPDHHDSGPITTSYYAAPDVYYDSEPAPIAIPEEPKEVRVAVGSRKSEFDSFEQEPGFGGFKSLLRSSQAPDESGQAEDAPQKDGARQDALEWRKLFLREGGSIEQEFRKVKMYIVQKEDTLDGIARKYNVPQRDLTNYNRLSTEDVQTGQILYIP